jgi:hypothetical protein
MSDNFVKIALANGGSIHPLIIPAELTNGTGTFNPSIYNDNGKLYINIRHCQVTLFHSEKNIFEHEWGPLSYLNPENDITLTTTNFFVELNNDFTMKWVSKVDFSKLDSQPIWEFRGLEDCRVFRWDDKLYISGVRRDTTTNGQGRMELCEIDISNTSSVKEMTRFRIPCPGVGTDVFAGTYCEKNWMPITDMPYHYLKWCNPVEVVKVFPDTKTCETAFLGKNSVFNKDQRGGSQVIPVGNNGDRFCITHEVDYYMGYRNENGKKNATYRHKFVLFDKDWNIPRYSQSFSFMNAEIEFCTGICEYGDDYLITFGVTDNAAYVLRCPKHVVENIFYG